MKYTDDPLEDFYAFEDEAEKREGKLPLCWDCEETIHDDYYYVIGGEILCENCLNDRYRRPIEDFIYG